MADRDKLLQVIGQELPSYVETADGLLYGPSIVKRGHGRMRVARVDDKQTFGGKSSDIRFTRQCPKKALYVMVGIQR